MNNQEAHFDIRITYGNTFFNMKYKSINFMIESMSEEDIENIERLEITFKKEIRTKRTVWIKNE